MRREEMCVTILKRTGWTESEILAFPDGEHDYFDRKAGAFLDRRDAIGKAVSALANSGGGHLLIGVLDDGTIEGVAPGRGRTPTREWLEQVIPSTVTPALSDFRVHVVTPKSTDSAIPLDRVVLVVDIADSRLAPHQAESQRIYFYREGGHSKPAAHFYIEALRNRFGAPVLRAELAHVDFTRVEAQDGGVLVTGWLVFQVTNDGNVAAYRWDVVVESYEGTPAAGSGLKVGRSAFPVPPAKDNISLDDTILPGLSRLHSGHPAGFFVETNRKDFAQVRSALAAIFPPDLVVNYRVVSEFSRGEPRSMVLRDSIDSERLAKLICS